MGFAFWLGMIAFSLGVLIGFRLRHLLALYDVQIVFERKGSASAAGADQAHVSRRSRKKEKRPRKRHEEPPAFLLTPQISRQGWLEVEKLKGHYTKLWMVLGSGWLMSFKTENTQSAGAQRWAASVRKMEIRVTDTRCFALKARRNGPRTPILVRAKDEREQKEWITAIEIAKRAAELPDGDSSSDGEVKDDRKEKESVPEKQPLTKQMQQRQEMVQVLRKRLGAGDWDERLLWRFAKARNWDVDRAAQSIHALVAWHAEYGAYPNMEAHMPQLLPIIQRRLCYLYGYNHKKEPCIIGFPARYIPKDMPTPAIVRFTVYIIENAIAAMKPPVETFCVIFDYTGLGWANVDQAMLREIINVLSNYYVERLGSLYVLNPTWVVHAVFKLFKSLIDPATREKLHFISANEELLQFFDKDKLPLSLGGTNPFEPEGESIGKETLGLS